MHEKTSRQISTPHSQFPSDTKVSEDHNEILQRFEQGSGVLSARNILSLQRTIGNRAVDRLIRMRSHDAKNIHRTYQFAASDISLTKAEFEELKDAVDDYAEYVVDTDFSTSGKLNQKQTEDMIAIGGKLIAIHDVFNRLADTYGKNRPKLWKNLWSYVAVTDVKVGNVRKRSGNFLKTLGETAEGNACHNELGMVLQACLKEFKDLGDE